MTESTGLRVVLADPDPVIRMGLRALCSVTDDVTVVGDAGCERDVVREVLLHRPDVLVTELCLSSAAVMRAVPGMAVLVFTASGADMSLRAAIRAGARGYVLKGADASEIVHAIRGVAGGGAIFGRRIAGQLLDLLSRPVQAVPFPELTCREREVLDLVATGISNLAIARRLCLASKTVSNHLSVIFVKLRVTNRAEAIVLAREAGLGCTGQISWEIGNPLPAG